MNVRNDFLPSFREPHSTFTLTLSFPRKQACSFWQARSKYIILCVYFWLHWVFVAGCGPSIVAASWVLQSDDFSSWWLLLLGSTGSQCSGSVVVVHGLCGLAACGIFLDQGLNSCPLDGRQILNHWTTRDVLAGHNWCCHLYLQPCFVWIPSQHLTLL